jgi:O-antigen/teichoic acid export membrane protein
MIARDAASRAELRVSSAAAFVRAMLRSIRRVLGGDLLTLVASVVVVVSGVVTGVLAARTLEAAGRGELAAVVSWAGLVLAVCTLGLEDAATRFGARHPMEIRAFLSHIRLAALPAMAVLGALLWLIFELTPIGEVLDSPVVAILAACGAVQVASQIGTGVLLGFRRVVHWNVARIASSVAYLGGVLAVVSAGSGTVDVFAVVLGGSWVVGLAAVIAGIRAELRSADLSLPADEPRRAPRARSVLGFSLRSHLANLSAMANYRLDQAVMFYLVTPSQLGQYAVAMTVIVAPGIVLQGQKYLAYSRLCHAAETTQFDATLRVERRRMLGLAFTIYGAVGAAGPFLVPLLFGPEYTQAGQLVALLAPSAVLLYLSRVLQSALKACGRASAAAIAELGAVAIAVGSLPLLVSRWGLVGACVASTAGYAIACIVETIFLARLRAYGTDPAGT